jgi:molybdopterin/thiamine biosynthesis adenylyltransferase
LRTQLPLLRQALESQNPEAFEELQAEPITTFYEYELGGIVLVDSGWTLPRDICSGRLRLASISGNSPIRAVVTAVSDFAGRPIAGGPFDPRNGKTINGVWFRTDHPIIENDPGRFVHALSQLHSGVGTALRHHEVIGVVFPEETGHRSTADGWIFLRPNTSGKRRSRHSTTTFVRAGRIGVSDISARYPQFVALQDRGAAIFGLGCLGAPSLLELARCGVRRLKFLDADFVEAGTIVRWPLGISAAGWPKAIALATFIDREYPWVSIVARGHRLGGVDQNPSDNVVFEEFLQDVDLVYDATAEIGLQNVLSDLARDRGLPYLCVSGVAGGVGGIVARLRPPRTGCWWCLQKFIDENTIPVPQATDNSTVQPQGCAAVTYVGANYDLQEVALQGVRMAISTLVQDGGDYNWDVGVVRLRGERGELIAPQWSTHVLLPHPTCPVCNS